MSVDASNVIIDVVETKVDSFMDKIKDTIENIHDAIPGISFYTCVAYRRPLQASRQTLRP